AGTPAVAVDELRPHGEFLQVLDERRAFGVAESFDLAGPAADVERAPARLWMAPRDRMPDVGALADLFLRQRGQVRVMHVVHAYAAKAGAAAHEGLSRAGIEGFERAIHI